MADDAKDKADLPPVPSLAQRLKKLVIMMSVLFALWLLFTYVLPRLVLPMQSSPAHTMAQPASSDVPADKDAQIAALTQRLSEVEAKLKTLEDVIAAAPKSGSDDATNAKIAALEAKITELSDQSADDERVTGIETKMTALQSQLGEAQAKNSRQLALMAAFDELKDTLNHGNALGVSLTKLTSLSDGQPKIQETLAQLAPFKDKGVATLTELQQKFNASAKLALSHSNSNALIDWHSLITIRKTGDQPGTDDEAVIARAEAALGRGELDKTLSELVTLSPTAAPSFAPWVADAQANVHAHETLAALQLAVAGDTAP